MAITHAAPGKVVDVAPLGPALAQTKTHTIFKTEHVELVRIVMEAGKVIAEHQAPREIMIHCLEGRIALSFSEQVVELTAGQLLYLAPATPHSVRCLEPASFLLTILLPH